MFLVFPQQNRVHIKITFQVVLKKSPYSDNSIVTRAGLVWLCDKIQLSFHYLWMYTRQRSTEKALVEEQQTVDMSDVLATPWHRRSDKRFLEDQQSCFLLPALRVSLFNLTKKLCRFYGQTASPWRNIFQTVQEGSLPLITEVLFDFLEKVPLTHENEAFALQI